MEDEDEDVASPVDGVLVVVTMGSMLLLSLSLVVADVVETVALALTLLMVGRLDREYDGLCLVVVVGVSRPFAVVSDGGGTGGGMSC